MVSARAADSFAGGKQWSASSLDQAVHKQEVLPNISEIYKSLNDLHGSL